MKIFLLYPIVFTLFAGARQNETALTLVTTKSGKLSGVLNEDKSISGFKGIPYAAPPVGELRWKEPQQVKPWTGTKVCDKFPASPYQNKPAPFAMWTEEFIAPPEPLSEDCLYLNVWTPAKSAKEKLPVVMWIYGGGFVSGSSACAIYDGEALARQGIVFVSINYRVGVFGFFSHPDLTKESGKNASGNYALLDQLAALRWIKDNITEFGGDPDRVTIAGQSAGSFSVQALVASPLSKGLFRGAIAHSGASMGRFSKNLIDAEKSGLELAYKIQAESVVALRNLSADSLLKLANTLPFGTFAPVIDGYVIPEDLGSIFLNKKHQDVSLMAGWVTGDAALSGPVKTAEQFKTWVSSTYPSHKDEFLNAFPSATDEEARQSQLKLGNLNFAGYADHQWALNNDSNSYLYQFSHVPTDKPGFPNYGAFHTSEVPFALHTLSKWNRPWKDSDYGVEKYMSAYWSNFVKTGNPNGAGLPEWKNYEAASQNIMELGEKPVLKPGMFKAELRVLERIKK
ncbi:MAG TPA: carboxylesterase family protein [Saprospiraceae bacterium]|nr:carboxylesterase family protein [Saprospiraceae bacterium]HNT21698.1 carboxylesterase family protein [Saprospiraceae bacterium]